MGNNVSEIKETTSFSISDSDNKYCVVCGAELYQEEQKICD